MFDHVEFKVRNLNQSSRFYRGVLATVGVKVLVENESMVGFGTGKIVGADGIPRVEFLIEQGSSAIPPLMLPLHIAFHSPDRAGVDGFHEAGISMGAVDNGKPGLRKSYHENYYAAFLIDPDGHNIEVVCHRGMGKTV